jgi:hypothetical protein
VRHQLDSTFREISLVPFRDRSLVVAPSDDDEVLRVWSVELSGITDETVEVLTLLVLGPERRTIRPLIPFSLHGAVHVTHVDDSSVPLYRLIEMLFLKRVASVRVVVMAIRREQEPLLVP